MQDGVTNMQVFHFIRQIKCIENTAKLWSHSNYVMFQLCATIMVAMATLSL